MPDPDLIVAGAGPGGLALAAEAVAAGLRVTVVDPAPHRPWERTFAAWADEVPDWATPAVAVRCDNVRAIGHKEQRIDRDYAVLDVPRLQLLLADRAASAELVTGRVEGGDAHHVRLSDGVSRGAAVVVDATGPRRVLLGPGRKVPAEQTAFGLMVDRAAAGLAEREAVFMDWRPEHGESGHPTFLYALDLGDGRALLEETSLAARPAYPLADLERRLRARLAARGIALSDDEEIERVRFAIDPPVPRKRGPIGFGAAGALVHPASGYSVAASFAAAPVLARALASALASGGPSAAVAAGHQALWGANARAARFVQRRGLEAMLHLGPDQMPGFFDTFLGLKVKRWAPFLGPRPRLGGTVTAMTATGLRVDLRTKASLAAGAFRRP
ncbi:MAG: lycopene cyclase family protein [Acidimicrobiia bacterium]